MSNPAEQPFDFHLVRIELNKALLSSPEHADKIHKHLQIIDLLNDAEVCIGDAGVLGNTLIEHAFQQLITGKTRDQAQSAMELLLLTTKVNFEQVMDEAFGTDSTKNPPNLN